MLSKQEIWKRIASDEITDEVVDTIKLALQHGWEKLEQHNKRLDAYIKHYGD